MTSFWHRASRSAVPGLLAILATLGLAGPASAGVVTISFGFGQYSGAVGNGTGIAGDREYQSIMNGSAIAPTEPIVGLEGLFIPPDPTDPSAVGTGIGRATVALNQASWVDFHTTLYDPSDESTHYGIENLIGFTPGPAVNVVPGGKFLLGTFTLQNGEWWAADAIHQFTFDMTTHSTDPALDGFVLSDILTWHVTPNGGPPENQADFFYLAGHPELGSMRVYEATDPNYSNFGTAQLYGHIGSLHLNEFANPNGGLFLSPSVDPFPQPPGPNPAPEPGSLMLFAAGLLALFGIRRAAPGRTSLTDRQ